MASAVTSIIEQGFVAYSQQRCVVLSVAEPTFEDPPANVHIKYAGYIKDDDFYIVKIASGFYDNPEKVYPPATV